MLSRLGNPLWMQEDNGQEQGQEQQGHAPLLPPAMGQGLIPALGQEEQNLTSLTATATGNVGFRAPVTLDDWYFEAMAATEGVGAGAQGSSFLASPSQAGGSLIGAGPQMLSVSNMGGVGQFDLGFSGGGFGELTSIAGANNTSNSSLLAPIPASNSSLLAPIPTSSSSLLAPIPSANVGLLGSFGGFGTAPAQMSGFSGFAGFDVFDNGAGSSSALPPASASLIAPFAACGNAAVLRPLEISPSMGAQPTLFQKHALQCNAGEEEDDKKGKAAAIPAVVASSGGGGMLLDDGDDNGLSVDASETNYDSEDAKDVKESAKKDDKDSDDANNTVIVGGTGDRKGKSKSLPAKNLMAERRRRKKLNDRLFMLRSAVPKITRMDRVSILSDAVEYIQELIKKINNLQNELEPFPFAAPPPLPPTPASFHPMPPSLPIHVKEEQCPSPTTAQQPSVEVRMTEGRFFNIHMVCGGNPNLLRSAMNAIENLGFEVQQANISCFNGLTLDIIKAELHREGPALQPEQIKAILLNTAGFQGTV